jgi:dsRNA-specific ribonuclease
MDNIAKQIFQDDDIIKSEEGLIFNPYNPLNIKITLSNVREILSKYGVSYNIQNFQLYERAFIHRSYTKRTHLENAAQNITIAPMPEGCLPLSTKSNERLEFLGDGVLELITKYYLYRRFPKENEGFMTEKKIAIIKNEAIGKIAMEMNLNKWLILSKHAEEKKIRNNLKKLGCLFEAFIGALFLDANKITIKDDDNLFSTVFVTGPGFQIAQQFVEKIFETHIDWVALIQNDDNYKNILQVKIQKEFKVTPYYLEILHDPDVGYKMGVYLCIGQSIYACTNETAMHIDTLKTFANIHEHISKHGSLFLFLGEGQHKIKRKAEQIACDLALQTITKYSADSK